MRRRFPKVVFMWTGYVLSFVSCVLFGFDYAFNVYAVPFKQAFNLTQTQVEIVASMSGLGTALGCLETFITWRFGYSVTFLLICMVTPLTNVFLTVAIHFNTFFHQWPVFIYLNHLILAACNSVGHMVVTRVCIQTAPREHTGKLVALFFTAITLAKVFLAGLLQLFFEEDLAGFFLTLAISFTIIVGICCICLYQITDKIEEKENVEKNYGLIQDQERAITTKDVMYSPYFHIIFWPTVIYYGSGHSTVNNITSIADSLQEKNPLVAVYIYTVSAASLRLICGLPFDRFLSQTCAYGMLLVSHICYTLSLLVGMFWLDRSTLVLTTVLIGIGMAPAFTVPAALICMTFGRVNYNLFTGLFILMSGVTEALFQLLVGYFYDAQIRELHTTGYRCIGPDCFYWSFLIIVIITLVLSFVRLGSCIFNLKKKS